MTLRHSDESSTSTLRDIVADWKLRARSLKHDVHALYLAKRDPRIPWYAKLLAVIIVAYALSPIDLIPDFIPIFGYLDDLVLLPAGILLLLKLIPPEVIREYRIKAQTADLVISRNWAVGLVIVLLWLVAIAISIRWAYQHFVH